MVSQQGLPDFLHDNVRALFRIRSVPDDIAQTEDGIDILIFNVVHHRAKRLEIRMDVAYQRYQWSLLW